MSGKVMKQILPKTISRHRRAKKLMGTSQHRFMEWKLCLTNLIAFYETGLVDEGRAINVVSLDFRKVFYAVSHFTFTNSFSTG